ncbi:carboxypeptidase-like regulatory domain-containing protein [Pareuzebyella sediminis]|uniref:carboxypeptidase-like regulatory domain-containing protein n=1 Tax=Pareuzebyella sediminis TaxID=2607998 RepID=UPI0011F04668|nr:carboxypeptidase-like regulatory domain-containing protein [Pareuzebyella sediminis]
MKSIKTLFLIMTMLFLCPMMSQKVSGTVLDSTGLGLPGANVVVKGTTNAVQADFDGNYVLSNTSSKDTLVFSYIGFLTLEVPIGNRSIINARMIEDHQALEEVVVTAMGMRRGKYDPLDEVPRFPWPPPLPSTKIEIPRNVMANCNYLDDVNDILVNALVENGYHDKGYFLVPARQKDGFALATQLEQIDKNGIAKKDPNRWNITPVDDNFSFDSFISALFFSNPGYFRLIVFIVTDKPFSANGKRVSRKTALAWIQEGVNSFPDRLRRVPFTKRHHVTALIYEYELPENALGASLLQPSRHSGLEHLKKSNLWSALAKE